MRICFFASADSIHTYRWITYFAKKGHKVSLISLRPPTFYYRGINVYILKRVKSAPTTISHLINLLPFLYQLWRLKRYIKPDVFHALRSSDGLLAAIVGFKPLIFTICDPGIFSTPYQHQLSKLDIITNKYAIKKSNLLVCDGENTKEAMIKLGAKTEKIKMIRFGVDIDKFKPQRVWTRNSKIIISTKPLRYECDVETLIRAIPNILKEVPKVQLRIVGDGDQKENLISLAKSLKVSKVIKFTGNISSDEIPLYLNSSAVFVGTSLVDTGLAASTAEAMACGVPMVVSDSGDNKLWIKDGVNGFIFPVKDSDALAEKVIYLLKNPDFRAKACKINREIIEETNNYHKEMKKMEKIYLKIIND